MAKSEGAAALGPPIARRRGVRRCRWVPVMVDMLMLLVGEAMAPLLTRLYYTRRQQPMDGHARAVRRSAAAGHPFLLTPRPAAVGGASAGAGGIQDGRHLRALGPPSAATTSCTRTPCCTCRCPRSRSSPRRSWRSTRSRRASSTRSGSRRSSSTPSSCSPSPPRCSASTTPPPPPPSAAAPAATPFSVASTPPASSSPCPRPPSTRSSCPCSRPPSTR